MSETTKIVCTSLRELDALVERHVFGNEATYDPPHKDAGGRDFEGQWWWESSEICEDGSRACGPLSRYTTDWNAMRKVWIAASMTLLSRHERLDQDGKRLGFNWWAVAPGVNTTAEHEEAGVAVALAALATKNIDVELRLEET